MFKKYILQIKQILWNLDLPNLSQFLDYAFLNIDYHSCMRYWWPISKTFSFHHGIFERLFLTFPCRRNVPFGHKSKRKTNGKPNIFKYWQLQYKQKGWSLMLVIFMWWNLSFKINHRQPSNICIACNWVIV